jgi:hypothetical protein
MYSDQEVLDELRYLYREMQENTETGMAVFRIRMMHYMMRADDS